MSTIQNNNFNSAEQNKQLDLLIGGIAKQDMQAFEQFYRLTDKAVYGFAFSMLGNTADAEDIMHDSYMKIRAAAYTYRSSGKPMAWVFTIVKRLCLMKLRQAQTKNSVSIDDIQENPDYSTLSPQHKSDDIIVLNTALRVLDDTERQIVLLHSVSGLKHREIAQILDMPLATVLSKYARSIAKLKKNLKES